MIHSTSFITWIVFLILTATGNFPVIGMILLSVGLGVNYLGYRSLKKKDKKYECLH